MRTTSAIPRYLQERGDANIKSNADLISKAKFYEDPNFPDRKQARQATERATPMYFSPDAKSRVNTEAGSTETK